jgi:ketosteroid isomerase-like protein
MIHNEEERVTQTTRAMDSVSQDQHATPLVLAQALVEAIESHELDRVPALYAANTRIEDPGGAVFESGEALKAHLGRLIEALPDIHHEVIHTIESGDSAVIQGRITGTHTGPLELPAGTIPPTGRQIDLRFAFLVRARDGAIVRDDLYFDRADMFEQLGLAQQAA